jgi:C-terminal processing protease CtpA/Prc
MKKTLLLLITVFLLINTSKSQENNTIIANYIKVWGLLKYYHPSFQKGKIEYKGFFLNNYDKVKKIKTTEQYNIFLDSIFTVVRSPKKLKKPYKYFPKDTTFNNLDFSWLKHSAIISNENKDYLNSIIENYKPYKSVAIENEMGKKAKKLFKYNYKNKPIKENESLLLLASYWNAVNYFNPHKRILDENWDTVLTKQISVFKQSNDLKTAYINLLKLTVKVNDSHCFNYNKELTEILKADKIKLFDCEIIDDKVISNNISDTLKKIFNIQNGDEILEINGISSLNLIKNLKLFIVGSSITSVNRDVGHNIAYSFLKDTINTFIFKNKLGEKTNIKFNSSDSLFINIARNIKYYNFRFNNINYKLIDKNVAYINPSNIKHKEMHKAFKLFKNTEYLIIDRRGYYGVSTYFFTARISNKRTVFAKYYDINLKYPGEFKPFARGMVKNNYLGIGFLFKKYKGKIVVLIDENSQSGAEYATMWYQALGATVIGRNSAGADGGILNFYPDTHFVTSFSGNVVVYPDGKQTQRIGIVPDIYVKKTVKAIRDGKDEILKKAINYINEEINLK